MSVWRKFFASITATFFGVGYIPVVPATFASAASALLTWYFIPGGTLLFWALGLSAAGLCACRPSQDIFNSKDPKQFVMDEVCGMMLTLLWLPKNPGLYAGAFFLFRILDVWKPWPISRIQESRHATSIMWDDLLAGVFANILLQIALRMVVNL